MRTRCGADASLKVPYQDNLSALIHEPTFRNAVDPAVFAKVKVIKDLGNLTSLKEAPLSPPGFDPKAVKVWLPNFEQYVKLHAAWVEEWNKTYNYRQ